MTERVKKYLFDIMFSIEAIEDFLIGYDFTKYKNDLKTKSAVERQLGIIGEAVNFRNRIIHVYDSIDDTIVWAIKTNHIPTLKNEIETLLN
jgi:uncharacterized protein with HEPN domain